VAVTAKLSLGPVLFNWPPEVLRDFYVRIADEAAVDTVYLGEVVCPKRAPFFVPYFEEVCERLTAAGKEIVHSTPALVMDEGEVEALREIVAGAVDLLLEANDIGCASLLAGRPHTIGPFVNVYNEGTLGYLAKRGAVRVSLPGELPAASLAALARTAPLELEVQVFGRLPLAISARCYHARSRNLHKDGCQYVCGEDPDGLAVYTLDDEPFLAVNGVQTLSYTYCNLVGELAALEGMGIQRFRLSPHRVDMAAVAQTFRDVLDRRLEAGQAAARLRSLLGEVPFSNGFFHGREGKAFLAGAGPGAE
jgi:collagenase-like PrtC family protease